jgi:class 3 adenylate cyclase
MTVAQDGPVPGEPSLESLEVLDGVPARLLDKWRRREFPKGTALIASGAPSDMIYILVRGHVAIVDGQTQIAMRSATCLLGEQGVLDGMPRSASAIAASTIVVYEIDGPALTELLEDRAFLRNLARELSRKLREATGERGWKYREHEMLFDAVGEFVAPEVVQDLLAKGDHGRPRRTDAVALFADVAGFTQKTLEMTPDDLNRDLSAFLDLAVEVVTDHGGLVDKFIGDEVMAIWGSSPHPEDSANAFLAAEELVRRSGDLTLNGEPLRIGVGLELGSVMLGVYGSEKKRQFTAIGPSVNLAARLQALTRDEQVPICLGSELVDHLPDDLKAKLDGPIHRQLRHIPGDTPIWTYTPKESDPR